ncbi:MAG: cold-shock protein [Rhodobacterales bacterium]|nr:MAG: cold-shock protein [Rhodobacterales bacterium]
MQDRPERERDMGRKAAPIHGRVKWFDSGKGFGFIVSDETDGGDILLHANVLRNFGLGSVAEGSRITLTAQRSDRGLQAVEILDLTPPDAPPDSDLPDLAELTSEEMAAIPLEPARVKWFDRAKGFGFANVFGKAEDVFIHIEVLRRSGLAELSPGEAIALRAIEGARGRMATMVAGWDSACLQGG